MTIYRFGDFEFDPGSARLEQLEGHVRTVVAADLQMRLLELLVQSAGRLVERRELQEALWGAGTYLEADNSLNTAVSRLREALGDSASMPRYVETVPRRGYRFVAPVEIVRNTDTTAHDTDEERIDDAGRWLFPVAVVGLAVLAWGVTSSLRTGQRELAPEHPESEPAPPTALLEPDSQTVDLIRARELLHRGTHEGLERAIATYVQVLAREPASADAYAGLTFAYVLLARYDYWHPRDALAPARAMAYRAAELDPESAAANLALAQVAAFSDWDWDEALKRTDFALELDPGYGDAAQFRASLLSVFGQHDEALLVMRKVLGREPASPSLNTEYGWLLFRARRPEEAIQQLHKTIELAPRHADAWDNLKWIHITNGDTDRASDAWERLVELVEGRGQEFRDTVTTLGFLPSLRLSVEERLARAAEPDYVSPYDLVIDLVVLGEYEQALLWLERAAAEQETDISIIGVDPRLDPLRSHERFEALLNRVALPTKASPGIASQGQAPATAR